MKSKLIVAVVLASHFASYAAVAQQQPNRPGTRPPANPNGGTHPNGGGTPGNGGTTPPAGGTTPPAGGTTPPAGNTTPPVTGDTTPPAVTPPVVIDTTRAREAGIAFGVEQGEHRGLENGEREGRRRSYAMGRERGWNEGTSRGQQQGEFEGSNLGKADGEAAGITDGTSHADRQSDIDCTPVGYAAGVADADRSDAIPKGTESGTAKGAADALARAKDYDQARGHHDYYNARFAENPANPNETFSQKQGDRSRADHNVSAGDRGEAEGACRRDYPEQENRDAFRNACVGEFNRVFGPAYERAANRRYVDAESQGINDGRNAGFDETYPRSKAIAYSSYRDHTYALTEPAVFQQRYPSFCASHTRTGHDNGYATEYARLFSTAEAIARANKYNEVYPGLAKAWYEQGTKDEAASFAAYPVRLLSVEPTETIPNRRFEPGEPLEVKVTVRNFADTAVAGKDVKILLASSNASTVTTGEQTLAQSLKPQSVTVVTRALGFMLADTSINQATHFGVTLQGKATGEQKAFTTTTLYQTDVNVAYAPKLSEGLKGQIALTVENNSTAATTNAMLSLQPQLGLLDVITNPVAAGPMAASADGQAKGGSFSAAFGVILRDNRAPSVLPIVATLQNESGRVIGKLDTVQSVDAQNEYRFSVIRGDLNELRKTTQGTVLKFRIRNVKSSVDNISLSLQTKIVGPEALNFNLLSPKVQKLPPVSEGGTTTFSVKVSSDKPNSGAIIEFTVYEGNKPVVIRQTIF